MLHILISCSGLSTRAWVRAPQVSTPHVPSDNRTASMQQLGLHERHEVKCWMQRQKRSRQKQKDSIAHSWMNIQFS